MFLSSAAFACTGYARTCASSAYPLRGDAIHAGNTGQLSKRHHATDTLRKQVPVPNLSSICLCRLRKDNYKGMSSAETKSIAEDQKAQVAAKLQRQKDEADRDRAASHMQDTFTVAWKLQQAEVGPDT